MDSLWCSLGATRVNWVFHARAKRAILARSDVKKPSPSSGSSTTTARRRGRRVLQSALVVFGAVVFIDALVGEKGLLEAVKKRAEYRRLEQSIQQSRSENQQLREDIRKLRDDPAAIEDLARRELGLMKPGEQLFIIKDVPPRP